MVQHTAAFVCIKDSHYLSAKTAIDTKFTNNMTVRTVTFSHRSYDMTFHSSVSIITFEVSYFRYHSNRTCIIGQIQLVCK